MPPTPIRHFAAFLALTLLALGAARADDQTQATTESRLRDALRDTMMQLRDAQGQLATAQAAQTQSDQDKAALQAKLDAANAQITAITKQSADDKAASDSAITDLKTQNAGLTTQIAKLNDALAAWEKDDKQYVELAKTKEAAREQLASQAILLQRTIDDRETKNLQLYNLANEILTRYQQYSLGDALVAKEPFTGVARVKLQEAVQDYRDRVADQRVIPGQVPSGPPPAVPAAPASTSAPAPVAGKSTPATPVPATSNAKGKGAREMAPGTATVQM